MDEKTVAQGDRPLKPRVFTPARRAASLAAARKSQAAAHARALQKYRVDANGCWIFSTRINRTGYGRLIANGRDMLAHRFFFLKMVGDIPPGMGVCHRCDVPACVNPDHLFLGTQRDNMADCAAKGRINKVPTAVGEAVASSKLTEELVVAIRAAKEAGEGTASIARRFNISRHTAWAVGTRRVWRHVR
jgi:hypothetical protein